MTVPKRTLSQRTTNILKVFILIIILLIIAYGITTQLLKSNGYVYPDYEKNDITMILEKDLITDAEYKELFFQTGLGKSAIDDLLKDNALGISTILRFQENFFTKREVSIINRWKLVKNEYVVNDTGKSINAFEFAPYQNGYILIRSSAHTFGWRHGHAGLILDAEEGEVLEAMTLGQSSKLRDINTWRNRPTFIMLKLKTDDQAISEEIANFAKEYLLDIPYRLTVGLLWDKNPDPDKLKYTQCSHVVWYPYNYFGYDIDSNGSWLVLPEDIAHSDLLEVVQIYGLDPNEYWRD